MSTADTQAQDELSALKARADLMGIPYHPSIGLEKLREKVNGAVVKDKPVEASPTQTGETEAQYRQRCMEEATKLVRIRVTCMNPNKKEWEGEILTVGNSVVGTHKKFVPFNADEGWHVPHIMYEELKARECQIFVTKTDSKGNKIRQGKLIKEFAIEVLPMLTKEELHELAQRQAMANSVD
jgi:hypothetical protein